MRLNGIRGYVPQMAGLEFFHELNDLSFIAHNKWSMSEGWLAPGSTTNEEHI